MGIFNDSTIKSDKNILLRDGSVSMTGDLNLGEKRIINVGKPEQDSDAVTKEFLDEIPGVSLTRSIKAAGGLFTEGVRIDGLPLVQPSTASSATSKKYVDDELKRVLPLDGSRAMTEDLNLGNNKITNLANPPVADSDAASKSYVDDSKFYNHAQTVNVFKLHSRNFMNTDGKLALFSFGVYKDYTSKYHHSPSHVAMTLSASPCHLRVNLGRLRNMKYAIRLEAITDPNGDNGSLDLRISEVTRKHKPEPNVVITNTVITGSPVSDTIIQIQVSYLINREIALFLYGRAGDEYVDPLLVDNIPRLSLDGSQTMKGDLDMGGKKITNMAAPASNNDAINKSWFERYMLIPRYANLESGNRKGEINVRVTDPNSNVDFLIRDGQIFEFKSSGSKHLYFGFPCLVNLKEIQFNSAISNSVSIDTDWSVFYYNEANSSPKTIKMTVSNYEKWAGRRTRAILTPKISKAFALYFNNITIGTKIYSIDFKTERGIYDTSS